jgi:hypothetical protein
MSDAQRLDRRRFEVVFEETFDGRHLDPGRWVEHYLPHWTTPERSAARYDLQRGLLRLRIDADQPSWPDETSGLRVSNLQTGSFSGPVGSPRGQHHHRPGLTVVTPQPTRRLYTPSTGMVEAALRAPADPTCMLAFWLIGFEDVGPAQSGEICVCELFGDAVNHDGASVNVGVKAHHDPRLQDDMAQIHLDIDGTDWHTYTAEWDPERVRFFVDGEHVRTVEQRIDYPLQLMIDLFEFPDGATRDPATYPKLGEVRSVRGYNHVTTA